VVVFDLRRCDQIDRETTVYTHPKMVKTAKRTEKDREHQEDILGWCVQNLVRSDLLEHVRHTHALWTKILCEPGPGVTSSSDSTLLRTYVYNTEISLIVNLYQLATTACSAAGLACNNARNEIVHDCLLRFYGQSWKDMNAKSQVKLRRRFLGKLNIGIVLMKLVAVFGNGILLMCSPQTMSK
jgi:hypothetical protein